MIGNKNLKRTLIISMLIAGLLPMLIAILVIKLKASEDLKAISYERLTADVNTRSGHLETYLRIIELQAETFGQQPVVINALNDFAPAFYDVLDATPDRDVVKSSLRGFYRNVFMAELAKHSDASPSVESLLPKSVDAQALQYLFLSNNEFPLGEKDGLIDMGGNTAYGTHHAQYHPVFRQFLKKFGYYDIFLVEAGTGQMVYSVYKETDYATNLFTGPHKDSGLAAAARKAMKLSRGETIMVDFEKYLPSYNSTAAFIGTPVFSGDRLLGSLVFQFPKSRINAIINTHDGLGETGESLLVGANQMRLSKSRFSNDDSYLQEQVNVSAFDSINDNGVVVEYVNDVKHLSAFAAVDVGSLGWTLLTRITADEALSASQTLIYIALAVAAMAAVVVTGFAYWLGRRVFQVLGGDPGDILAIADSIGNGHLMAEDDDDKAIGARAALVAMRTRLRSVMSDSTRVTQDVKSEAGVMSEGSLGLSERTEKQASDLEETAASTQQLSITVRRNADSAVAANELAVGTRKLAIENRQLAKGAIGAMQDINTSSSRIADITRVIDEIAFQTSLLALNAAVEAARAGEHGRGFAVVASEVRQLAGRSASAASEITELITDSVQQVQDGTGIVERTAVALEEILDSVNNLTEIVGQISVASEEQATGIDQINQALANMDGVTQQNMSLAEDAAQTSGKLNTLATELTEQMSYFSVGQR